MIPNRGIRRGLFWSCAIEVAPELEAWYRRYLRTAKVDVSSSGVQPYTLGEVLEITGLERTALLALTMEDGYSYGSPELRQAIADRYIAGRFHNVLVTHGSSEAIALCLTSLLTPGSRVLITGPIYHSFRFFAERSGCEIITIPVEAFRSKCSLEEALSRFLTASTRFVIVNFPHNPTGISLDSDSAELLVERVARIGSILIWDAAMVELPMCGCRHPDLTSSYERSITIGTLSKAFGLPGLRVGWCIAPETILSQLVALRDRTALFLSPLVEVVATAVVQQADAIIGPRLVQAQANLRFVADWAAQNSDLVSWTPPRGGVCGLLSLGSSVLSQPLCRELLEATGILLVPGTAFGREHHVRLGYGGRGEELKAALPMFSDFLRSRGCQS